MAGSAQSKQDQHADEGFQYIEMWMQNSTGGTPSQDELADMADSKGMTTVPNLADGGNEWAKFELDNGIPTVSFIGPDMTILAIDTYSTDPGSWIE